MGNIFLSVLGISVSIGLTSIVLILLTPLLNKRYAAKWKYLIWIFLALQLIAPFGRANGQYVMDKLSQLKAQTNTADSIDVSTPYRRIIVELPAQVTAPIKASSEKNKAGITMLDIVSLVWIIGCLIFISVHLISYSHYKRQVIKKGRIITETHIISQMSRLKHELHIRRTICLIEYNEAESPMVIGFAKPFLVLPKEQYSSENLYFILKHELVHLKRGDVYLKLLFITANAIHWFNPCIWIMHKEAVIDMELSCDERVTQGTSYALRKAYTETLLSMLHKRCVKKTVLSTQFYGGTKIMKKRFKNILIKNRKKNGISILICAIVLTISLGTLVGCSVAKKDTENAVKQSETKASQIELIPVDNSSDENNALENTTTLTFSKEGEQEQKQAALAIGNGYSLYLPDDEQWRLSSPDQWTSDKNEQVSLRVTHFEGESVDSVNQKLEDDGYAMEDSYKWRKQEGDFIYHVEQKVFENNVWGIFYSYPLDFEEGWGREFPVIVNTFALSDGADQNRKANAAAGTSEYLADEDFQKIRTVLDEFAKAYFNGNADDIQKFLASTYEGEIDIYEGTGTISDLTVRELSDADKEKIENGKCSISIEFRDSNYEDMFLYLTSILVKEEDNWKIQFYGVEG